jgi:hypothetical protein
LSPKSGAEADLKLRYPDEETAKAIAESVGPDNYQAPQGLELNIEQMGTEVAVKVLCPKGVGSLISTLDDLLSCLSAAEKALNGVS